MFPVLDALLEFPLFDVFATLVMALHAEATLMPSVFPTTVEDATRTGLRMESQYSAMPMMFAVYNAEMSEPNVLLMPTAELVYLELME